MDLFLIAVASFFIFVVAIFLLPFFFFFRYSTHFFGAGFQPMPKRIVRKMLKMAEIKKGETLYDLGCGDGRFLILGAKEFGAYGVGIEISPIRYLWAKFNVINNQLWNKVKIRFGNLFKAKISDADVIVIFLTDRANKRLVPKFKKELKPGTRIVSHYWQLPEIVPQKIDEKDKIYLYKF